MPIRVCHDSIPNRAATAPITQLVDRIPYRGASHVSRDTLQPCESNFSFGVDALSCDSTGRFAPSGHALWAPREAGDVSYQNYPKTKRSNGLNCSLKAINPVCGIRFNRSIPNSRENYS